MHVRVYRAVHFHANADTPLPTRPRCGNNCHHLTTEQFRSSSIAARLGRCLRRSAVLRAGRFLINLKNRLEGI